MGPSAVIASLLIKLGLDPSGVQTGVQQAQGSLGSLQSKANLATAMAGAAIGNFVVGGMEAFQRFDDRMREVFSIMPGVTQDTMDQMTGDIRGIAKEMGVAAEEVAAGVYDAISSGIDPTQVTSFIETATKAAVAGVSDAKSASAVLAATLNAYSMDASHAQEVADTLFQTVKVGVTTFPELAAEMATISPVASVMGVDLTQTTAALAAMTLQGHSTASAATDIAAVFTLLQKGTPELNRVLEEAGYANGQAAIDALGFQGTLEMLRNTADSLGIAIPKMTGRVQAANAIFALTGDKAGAALDVLNSYEDATGSVDYAFEVMESGIGGTVRRLQSTLGDLAITVGQTLEPIAPLFLAFGPQMGRLLGAGIGSGLALGMKGLASIARQAMPGLTAELTAMGAQAGGGMAKGLAQSIATSIKSAGWKKLAFGGLAMAGGIAMSEGAFGTFGGMEKVAGGLTAVAGAFAMGGPVMAAITAVTLAIQELSNFMTTVGNAQADLNAKVAGVVEQTGQESLTFLAKTVKGLQEAEGFARIIGDTFAGQQEMDALTALTANIVNAERLSAYEISQAIDLVAQAQVEALARGNQKVADELGGQITMLEGMRDTAMSSMDGLWHGVAKETAEGADEAADAADEGGDKVAAAVYKAFGKVGERIAASAGLIDKAWGMVGNALAKGPPIRTMEQRLGRSRRAIQHATKMLAKAVRAGDVVAAAYYSDQVKQARGARQMLKGNAESVMADATKVLGEARRRAKAQHAAMATDADKETKRGMNKVLKHAEESGKAMPDELKKGRPKAAAAAKGMSDDVIGPMEQTATDAATWGSHAGANFASGLQSQVPAVAAASAALAAAAAGPIKFESPAPKVGAMRNIRLWGPHMLASWLGPVRARMNEVSRLGEALGASLQPRLQPLAVPAGWDGMRTAMPRAAAERYASGRGRGEVHFHIGTLIADERGLDELDRRMDNRRRLRRRGQARYNDAG